MTSVGRSWQGSGSEQAEFRTIADAFRVLSTGRGVNRTEYSNGSLIPIVDQGVGTVAGYTDDDSLAVEKSEYVVFGDHTRAVKWVDFKFAPGADGTKVLRAAPDIEPKFGYYALANLDVPSRGYNRHWTVVREMKIPVPPLEVQREIVRILDNFTELEAQLEAEREARRRQWHHYKALVLSSDPRPETATVGEVCEVFGGAPFKSEFFNTDRSGLPVVRIRDINTGFSATYYSGSFEEKYRVRDGDILIGMDGDFRTIRWSSGDAVLNQRVARLQEFDVRVNPGFVFHVVREALVEIQAHTQGSTVAHLSTKQIRAIQVPLYPLEEQRRRAAILDKFDALVNDLSVGLPAELAARRKQYEYYRDKLLTFEEAPA